MRLDPPAWTRPSLLTLLIGAFEIFDKGPASQGTPPNSPAAVSAFARVVGAASQTNKQPQNQVQGNPLGIAAVLLQGAQGNSVGEIGPRGKYGRKVNDVFLNDLRKRSRTISFGIPLRGQFILEQ